jgi:hypothetical protein
MNPYHKYMLFYTGLQIIGVAGLMKLVEYDKMIQYEKK